jgi:hypothetical protein
VLIVVDAANVVGSVPDGWWRDRAGATERLRDALALAGPGALAGTLRGASDGASERGSDGGSDGASEGGSDGASDGASGGGLAGDELVLVVEGAARRVATVSGVRVVSAAGSGDDAIVDLIRDRGSRAAVVVTADRGLRERVTALGAQVVGPGALNIRR